MLVKCTVCKTETMYVEIPDEFRRLATRDFTEIANTPAEVYEECAEVLTEITGYDWDEYSNAYFISVESAENGETMLEL